MSDLKEAFVIKCTRCNKVLNNNNDGGPVNYRKLIFIRVDSNHNEHLGRICLCEDCAKIVEESIREALESEKQKEEDLKKIPMPIKVGGEEMNCIVKSYGYTEDTCCEK